MTFIRGLGHLKAVSQTFQTVDWASWERPDCMLEGLVHVKVDFGPVLGAIISKLSAKVLKGILFVRNPWNDHSAPRGSPKLIYNDCRCNSESLCESGL